MKTVQDLEDYNILLKRVTKTKRNKRTKRWLPRNTGRHFRINFARKFIIRKRNCKSWLWKKMGFLMPPHPLRYFGIRKCYQNEPRFNGVSSTDNLPKKIKNGAYVMKLDEYVDVGTHWIALF